MLDKKYLRDCLGSLIQESDSKVSRTAIETLLKIHRNILYNQSEVRYRSISPENPNFLEKVWSLLPCRKFMKKCGWISAHNRYFFNSDEALVDIIEILLQYRDIQPREKEWVKESKIVTTNVETLREEELRRKAAIERRKEIDEFEKEKKFKEELAKQTHAEIEADRKRKRELRGNGYYYDTKKTSNYGNFH